MLRTALTMLQVFVSLAIVALVLLQRGKGADAGAGFGAGASGTVFGARGARTALSRATAIFAAIFMVNSLALAYMGTRAVEQPKSILDRPAASTPAPAATPAPATSLPQPATPAPSTPPADTTASPPAPASGGVENDTNAPR
jgi:preprotein translocase subunit SecG